MRHILENFGRPMRALDVYCQQKMRLWKGEGYIPHFLSVLVEEVRVEEAGTRRADLSG